MNIQYILIYIVIGLIISLLYYTDKDKIKTIEKFYKVRFTFKIQLGTIVLGVLFWPMLLLNSLVEK